MSWEVWTMKLKMSFFDWKLLKKNISRFAPAWALLLLFQFLIGPQALSNAVVDRDFEWRYENAVNHLGNLADIAGPVMAFASAILIAGLLFKYLHNPRSAYMMHAFPMTRTCLLVTNAVSGLLFWLLPSLVTSILNLMVLGLYKIPDCTGLVFTMLGKWTLQYLCFYGIAVFSVLLSGNMIIAVLSYGALNFLCMFLPILFLMMAALFFCGLDLTLSPAIGRLAPLVGMIMEGDSRPADRHPALLWIYAAVGLVLLILAWIHYRQRHIERAGDAMAYSWARMAFRVLFTVCVCLGFGVICTEITEEWDAFTPYALLGCFLGWFGASMMTERTVKVFRNRKIWLGFGISAAVLVLTVLGLRFDLLGWQRRIPKAETVESVEIWSVDENWVEYDTHITLTGDDIELIRGIHQEVLDYSNRGDNWRTMNGLFRSYYSDDEIHICYHLAGGGTLRRVYYGIPDHARTKLENLYARPDISAAWYERNLPKDITRAYIYIETMFAGDDFPEGITIDDVYVSYEENGVKYYTYTEEWECRDLKALRDAMLADAAAGRLPIPHNVIYDYAIGPSYDGQTIYHLMIERKMDQNGYYATLPLDIPESATETLALFKKP